MGWAAGWRGAAAGWWSSGDNVRAPDATGRLRRKPVALTGSAGMFPIKNAVPMRYPPVVTWTLIAINCAVFLFQISLKPVAEERFVLTFALVPARYFVGSPSSLADYLPFLTPTLMQC